MDDGDLSTEESRVPVGERLFLAELQEVRQRVDECQPYGHLLDETVAFKHGAAHRDVVGDRVGEAPVHHAPCEQNGPHGVELSVEVVGDGRYQTLVVAHVAIKDIAALPVVVDLDAEVVREQMKDDLAGHRRATVVSSKTDGATVAESTAGRT